jgi:hypothetical protein
MNETVMTPVQPYIGPRPFETRDRHLFFGRDREVYEISSLVLANRYFVLYAASGAGKTSLFNAGVRPLLEDDLEILPTVRFQAGVPDSLPRDANVYTYAALSGWADRRQISKLSRTRLAEYLDRRPRKLVEALDTPLPRLLVFDQFEELFTTHPDRWPQRQEFLEQLAEAGEKDPSLRVLVVIREDYLARLLSFADTLFSGLKDRYFLEGLRKPAAEMAVTGPLRDSGRSFESGAVEELVRRLMTTRIDIGDQRIREIEGEFAEPVLLQVVCQTLWNRLPSDISIITLRNIEDVDTSLARFYSDVVREAAERFELPERQIREWVAQKLITHPGGTRGIVYVGPKTTEGLPNKVTTFLEGKLLRAEFRAGARWLEITHDSLLRPIERSNAEFLRSFDRPVDRLADDLAIAVAAAWQNEAAARRLNDPYPLSVRWAPADPSLVDPWSALVAVASTGTGWPKPGGGWAADASELGRYTRLSSVLAHIPTGRLLVFGEPGSGKTTLMILLLLDLLASRKSGDRVPVLLSAAAWNPLSQDLRSWLADRLSADYPRLASRLPGKPPIRGSDALLAAGLIMPILDGLDEIPEAVRGIAISMINDALRPGEGIVVTCRTAVYRAAVRPAQGPEVTLRAAAGVELQPLNPEDVAKYLLAGAGGPKAAGRWDPVVRNMTAGAPLSRFLATPLAVTLASSVYNPRPGELGPARDPQELVSPALSDRAALDAHLLDAFIPAAYRSGSGHGQSNLMQAERYLGFLARHLEFTIRGPDLAWWQLGRALPRRLLALTGALIGALAGVLLFGLAGSLSDGMTAGLAGGGAGGLSLGLLLGTAAGRERRPVSHLRWRLTEAVFAGPAAGLAGVLAGGLLAGLGPGLALGLVLTLAGVAVTGVKPVTADLGMYPSPGALLDLDRRTALTFGLVGGLVAGLASGLAIGSFLGLVAGVALGLAAGVAAALVVGSFVSAWPRWQVTRAWLALRHRIPWRFLAFLDDAHQRGVLRQAGPVYQFRSRGLQRRLAAEPHPDL